MIFLSMVLGLLLGVVLHELYINVYEPYKYRHFDIEKYIKENTKSIGNIYNIDISKCPTSIYLIGKIIEYIKCHNDVVKNCKMDFNKYQEETDKTALFPRDNGMNILYPVLGLCGESGEVAEKVKKVFRDNNGVVTEEVRYAIKKELGDVMWYISQSCRAFNFTMEEVAIDNIKKLEERQRKNTINGSGDNR